MKDFSFLFVALMVSLVSCDNEISSYPRADMDFGKLPDTVKYYYLDYIRPVVLKNPKDERERYQAKKRDLICVNGSKGRCRLKIDWVGPFVYEYLFQINDKKLSLGNNGNTINAPYILFENQFYFLINKSNGSSADDVQKAKYGKFDLTRVF